MFDAGICLAVEYSASLQQLLTSIWDTLLLMACLISDWKKVWSEWKNLTLLLLEKHLTLQQYEVKTVCCVSRAQKPSTSLYTLFLFISADRVYELSKACLWQHPQPTLSPFHAAGSQAQAVQGLHTFNAALINLLLSFSLLLGVTHRTWSLCCFLKWS